MPDFHLSKSEIFFYGALAYSLHPLMPSSDDTSTERIEELFPALRDLWPADVDPFSTLEQLAIDFGIARRPELDPAGDDEQHPSNPEFRGAVPEDTVWTLADGSTMSTEEFTDITQRLKAVFDEARGDHGATDWKDFAVGTMQHPAYLLDAATGIPQWVTLNLHQRSFKEYTDSLGAYVAEGESASEPGYVYRLSWRGIMYRYQVTQQTNPLYQALVHRFLDELQPPRAVLLSLMKPPAAAAVADAGPGLAAASREQADACAGRPKAPRLTAWLADLASHYGETPEWNVAHSLAAARCAAQTLERYMTQHDAVFAAMLDGQESLRQMSTRERLQDFYEYITDIVEQRVEAFQASGRGYSEPTPEEMPLINARALSQLACDMMYSAAAAANDLGLTEVVTVAEGGGAMARRFDQTLKEVTFGASAIQDLRHGSRDLGDLASNGMRLAYGQLFFRELAQDQVYLDPNTQAAILKQPKAVRAQLIEAISQFERQTLPNCTVTSAVGLIEPLAWQINQNWNPRATFGTTSEMLNQVLRHLIKERTTLRPREDDPRPPTPEEIDNLLKLYCVNLAFGLHALTNSVRHYADKVLERHDAGVMLHGLCVLLKRMNT